MVFYTQGNAIEKLVADGWDNELQINETRAAAKHLIDLYKKVQPNLMQNEITETAATKNNRQEVTAYLVDNKVKKAPKIPSPDKGPKQQPITNFFTPEKLQEPQTKPKKKSTLTIKKAGKS